MKDFYDYLNEPEEDRLAWQDEDDEPEIDEDREELERLGVHFEGDEWPDSE